MSHILGGNSLMMLLGCMYVCVHWRKERGREAGKVGRDGNELLHGRTCVCGLNFPQYKQKPQWTVHYIMLLLSHCWSIALRIHTMSCDITYTHTHTHTHMQLHTHLNPWYSSVVTQRGVDHLDRWYLQEPPKDHKYDVCHYYADQEQQ